MDVINNSINDRLEFKSTFDESMIDTQKITSLSVNSSSDLEVVTHVVKIIRETGEECNTLIKILKSEGDSDELFNINKELTSVLNMVNLFFKHATEVKSDLSAFKEWLDKVVSIKKRLEKMKIIVDAVKKATPDVKDIESGLISKINEINKIKSRDVNLDKLLKIIVMSLLRCMKDFNTKYKIDEQEINLVNQRVRDYELLKLRFETVYSDLMNSTDAWSLINMEKQYEEALKKMERVEKSLIDEKKGSTLNLAPFLKSQHIINQFQLNVSVFNLPPDENVFYNYFSGVTPTLDVNYTHVDNVKQLIKGYEDFITVSDQYCEELKHLNTGKEFQKNEIDSLLKRKSEFEKFVNDLLQEYPLMDQDIFLIEFMKDLDKAFKEFGFDLPFDALYLKYANDNQIVDIDFTQHVDQCDAWLTYAEDLYKKEEDIIHFLDVKNAYRKYKKEIFRVMHAHNLRVSDPSIADELDGRAAEVEHLIDQLNIKILNSDAVEEALKIITVNLRMVVKSLDSYYLYIRDIPMDKKQYFRGDEHLNGYLISEFSYIIQLVKSVKTPIFLPWKKIILAQYKTWKNFKHAQETILNKSTPLLPDSVSQSLHQLEDEICSFFSAKLIYETYDEYCIQSMERMKQLFKDNKINFTATDPISTTCADVEQRINQVEALADNIENSASYRSYHMLIETAMQSFDNLKRMNGTQKILFDIQTNPGAYDRPGVYEDVPKLTKRDILQNNLFYYN